MSDVWPRIASQVASDSLLALTLLLTTGALVMLALLYWTGAARRGLVVKSAVVAAAIHLAILLAAAQFPGAVASASAPEEVVVVPIELRPEEETSGEPSLVDLEHGLTSSRPVEPELDKAEDPPSDPLLRDLSDPADAPAPEVAAVEPDLPTPVESSFAIPEAAQAPLDPSTAPEPEVLVDATPTMLPSESLAPPETPLEAPEPEAPLETPAAPISAPPLASIPDEPTPPTRPLIDLPSTPPPSPSVSPLPEPSPSPARQPGLTASVVVDEGAARPAPPPRPSRAVEAPPAAIRPPQVPEPRALGEELDPVVSVPPHRADIVGESRPNLPTPPPAPPKSSTDAPSTGPRFSLEEAIPLDPSAPMARRTVEPSATDPTQVDIAGLVARSRPFEPQVEAVEADRARYWENRTAPNRLDIVVQHGGSERTERAVAMALAWLAAHQSGDGRWDSDGFDANCPDGDRCDGHAIENQSDSGLTGLALLAFLGAGHTHTKASEYQETVRRGLSWLLRIQRPDGDLQLGGRIYSHSMATLALTEALAMTGDDRLRGPAQRAVTWLAQAQHAESGGWRYGPNQFGDTSVFGWAVLALRSARSAGLSVPAVTWTQAQRWIPTVSYGARGGLAAYRPGYAVSHAMTAEALFCRQVLGGRQDAALVDEAAEYVLGRLPSPDDYHLYYWYYGTLAMFQVGGERWQRWNSQLTETLLATQRESGHARGSWDPQRPFGVDGGRVFATAASAMCLEVYYRYLPLYGQSRPADASVPAPAPSP